MVGAYVAVLGKATDYWFKDKDDPEHKEADHEADWQVLMERLYLGPMHCFSPGDFFLTNFSQCF